MRIFTRMFRSVDWTHDMIIVKWHLFIWHKRKLCAVTNAPPVQSTQRGQWLSTLFHFVYLMMTNVMVKTCLNQKIIKNSNLIQAMKNNVCPKATVIRRPNFSKNSPNVPKCRLNTRYDNREVTWSDSYSIFPKAELVRIFTECSLPNVRKFDFTHDMIIVKRHLFIWHERKLCALTNAPPVQSTQTGQWLSTLFHANCSAALVYVLYPR